MKQIYDITLRVRIVHEIDDCTDYPENGEVAEYVGQLVCDELVDRNTVVGYDILNSSSSVE